MLAGIPPAHYDMTAATLPADPAPRFLPLFAVALALRFAVVVLGVLLIPVQPARPIKLFGLAIGGFPADLRPAADSHPATEERRQHILATSARLIEPWYRWDAEWMILVAREGYARAADQRGQVGAAFMPVMPAIAATAEAIGLNPFWWALITANLSAAGGMAVLARVAARLTNDRAVGLRTFILINVFPTAFFFSAPYNEAFGLFFIALALAAWLDQKAGKAAVFAVLGSLARVTGVAVGAAALAGWLLDDRSRPGLKRALVVATGSIGGLLLFWAYLGWAVGDPFAGLKSHAAWGRRPLALSNVRYAIVSIYDPELPHWGEAFLVLLFTLLGIRAWIRRGTFWGVLTLVPVAQMMLSGTLLSAHRVILAAVPGFIELADLLKNRLYFRLVVLGFALAQLVLLNRYVHWLFAG
jgi:hypothetical protein